MNASQSAFQTPDATDNYVVENASVSEVDSLQPSGVLNSEAMRGKFSLRHILSASHEDTHEQATVASQSFAVEDDPIHLGLISYHAAQSLFEK